MTVLNTSPTSRERLADNGQAAFVTGETIGFRESDLPPRDTIELNRIARELAQTSGVNPEDFDVSRIEQATQVGGPRELIARELAPVTPLTPQAFAAHIGDSVERLRGNLMGEEAA